MSDILDCLTPLYYTSKLFAQANYKFLYNPQKRTVCLCSKSKIYSILFTISLIFALGVLQYKNKHFANHQNILLQVVFLVVNVLFASSILWNNLINSDKLVKILRELMLIDKSLKKNGVIINYNYERKITTTLLIPQFLLICYYIIFTLSKKETELSFVDLIIFICFFVLKAVQTCFVVQVEVFTLLLKIRFDFLRNILTRNITNQFYLSSTVTKTANLYQEINSVARNVNDFYTIPLTGLILLNFMALLLLGYDLLQVGFNTDKTFMYESYIVTQILLFVVVVYCCSISSDAVSELSILL